MWAKIGYGRRPASPVTSHASRRVGRPGRRDLRAEGRLPAERALRHEPEDAGGDPQAEGRRNSSATIGSAAVPDTIGFFGWSRTARRVELRAQERRGSLHVERRTGRHRHRRPADRPRGRQLASVHVGGGLTEGEMAGPHRGRSRLRTGGRRGVSRRPTGASRAATRPWSARGSSCRERTSPPASSCRPPAFRRTIPRRWRR